MGFCLQCRIRRKRTMDILDKVNEVLKEKESVIETKESKETKKDVVIEEEEDLGAELMDEAHINPQKYIKKDEEDLGAEYI